MMKAYCTFCKNTVGSKQITDWTKWKEELVYSDDIDGDADTYEKVKTKYYLVRLHDHKKGFLKRTRCEGSGKKKLVKI
jgi:hypothetical protein